MIKGEEKNRGYWKIGIVNYLYIGKDNIIRFDQLGTRKTLIDRPIQLLYSLELHCEGITPIFSEDFLVVTKSMKGEDIHICN